MKLSILDQVPILEGASSERALSETVKLATYAEKWGFSRFWVAEHHNMKELTCPAPEVLIPYIGAHTNTISLGAGAILLPHYKPYKIAESFNLLATLFPGRIDLGIGRAPGGSAEATEALSDAYLQEVWKMPEKVKELLHFLRNDFPHDSIFSKVKPTPVPTYSPRPWILGTSRKSALLAAEMGTYYAFGQFMSDEDGSDIISEYKTTFMSLHPDKKPYAIVAVSILCAETLEKAEELALNHYFTRSKFTSTSSSATTITERNQILKNLHSKIIFGTPESVEKRLHTLQKSYNADEWMIVTIPSSYQERLHSFELLAKQMIC